MNFHGNTFNELRRSVVAALAQDTSLKMMPPGSPMLAFVDAILQVIATNNRDVDTFLRLTQLSNARGAYLDIIGSNIFGLNRTVAVPAAIMSTDKNLKFYVNSGTLRSVLGTTKIASGTTVRTEDASVVYMVDYDIPLGVSDTYVYASAAAINSGSDGNCAANTLTVHNLGNSSVYVTNLYPVESGSDVESDDMFRARIQAWAMSARSSNVFSIRAELMKLPDVADVQIVPASDGAGTFKVVLIPTTSTISALTKMRARAALETTTACGVIGYLYEPDYVPIKIALRLTFAEGLSADAKNAIRDQISSEIKAYLESIPVGGILVTNRITAIAMANAEVKDSDFWCLKVKGQLMRRVNYVLSTNEMFVLDSDEQIPIEVI